ncbi:MAG: FG-GAP-like repeat-containing protein [Planctomycetota bacterium]|jgi:hypothetical protein
MNRQCSIHVFDGSFLVPGALTRVRRMSALTAAVTLGAFGTPEARCGDGPHFVDEAFVRGIDYVVTQGDWNEQFGCGVGLIDLDDDGDPDLVVTGREDGVVGVYENDGTGHFIDRSTTSGILPMDMPSGVVAGDYDRDGDRDIYITNYKTADVMLRNDGGFTFTDVTVEAGLGHTGAGCGASFNDYNGDGWIDLFVAARTHSQAPENDALYRNNGDGTFTDVAPRLGVDSDFPTFQPIFFDHDLDGDQDLYLSTDKGSDCDFTNRLFENIGGDFVEITESSGTQACIDSMGVTAGDFDGNGYPDFYCTNLPYGNILMLNEGDGTFTESSVLAGVADDGFGWATAFFDPDHDADLDLIVCNGPGPNRLFVGGTWPCEDVAVPWALAGNEETFCMAMADIEGDGDLDIVMQARTAPIQLMVNEFESDAHWAMFDVRGVHGGRDGIGARLIVTAGGITQQREVRAGTNYKSQDGMLVHVGLGDARVIDELTVIWPTGLTRTLNGVEVDQVTVIDAPPGSPDLNGDGGVDVADLIELILGWGPCGPGACGADLDQNGQVDVEDMVDLLLAWGT